MMPRKQWERSTDPAEVLSAFYMQLTNRGTKPLRARKVTLYLAALCRRVWDELPWICRALTELAERCADDPSAVSGPRQVLNSTATLLRHFSWDCESRAIRASSRYAPSSTLALRVADLAKLGFTKSPEADDHLHTLTDERFRALSWLVEGFASTRYSGPFVPAEFHSLALLRDIAGNPYRPVKCKPQWRTDTVLTLARQMYESREFGAMPILADALQDAGCNSEEMLNHCREPGEHARGCWIVDLVLGKE